MRCRAPISGLVEIMVRTEIGHVKIEIGDKEYMLVPSFVNISKIGTPRQIVESFGIIDNPVKFHYKLEGGKTVLVNYDFAQGFEHAAWILQCCGLPEKLTGYITIRDNSQGYPCTYVVQGKINTHDVFVLAAHCLKHGVCGIATDNSKSEPMTEFDARFFIILAQSALGSTLEQAERMTMTELSMYMEAKKSFDSGDHVKKAELKIQKDAFAWFNKKKGLNNG